MAKRKQKKEIKPSFIKKLFCNLFGTALIVFTCLVLVSLLGYNEADPSFNKSTSNEISNFLGAFGAYSADAVLRSFGLSLIVFLIVPIVWGYGLVKYKSFPEWKMRLFSWGVGVLCLASFLDLTCSSYLGSLNLPYNLTGEWSRFVSRYINNYINTLNLSYYSIILKSIILFVSILSFNFTLGITFSLWISLLKRIFSLIRYVFVKIMNLFKKMVNIKNVNEFKELNPFYLQNKVSQKNNLHLNRRKEPLFSQLNNLSEKIGTEKDSIKNDISIEISGNKGGGKNNSYSPTFDFINDDVANQNEKKIKKKNFGLNLGKKKNNELNETKQEELLTVNSSNVTDFQSVKKQLSATSSLEDISQYHLPDINLLSAPKDTGNIVYDENVLKENAVKLEEVLKDFGIKGQIVKVRPGPVVTLYELEPAPGTRTARVIGLSDDIARSMAVASVRMAVVSGHNTIGIELPNETRQTVWLRELLEDKEFTNSKNILNVTLGKDIGGQHVYADLSKMPHLLVAGTTGSGKSVGVNSMILSLLFRMSPEQCKLIMIDPKQLEFSMYNGIPHLLTPVITDPGKAVVGLKWAVREMEDRYRAMALLNVRNIAGYNQKVADMRKSGKEIKKTIQTGFDKETGKPIYDEQIIDTTPMPYIVVVVDEMADLMLVAGKEVEAAIQRLAQMARAAGIHLIMSTQRPSVDVITGTIKANFPSRISFHVTTKIDSRTIIGEQGAEQLLGMGDMLYMPSGLRPVRVHGCFVTDAEVEKVVEYIKSQGEPEYVSDVTEGELNTKDSGPVFDKGAISGANDDDDLYNQAVAIVRADKKASTSYIQRKLRLGYNRAAILIERMEDEGIVTAPDRVGRREVIGAD